MLEYPILCLTLKHNGAQLTAQRTASGEPGPLLIHLKILCKACSLSSYVSSLWQYIGVTATYPTADPAHPVWNGRARHHPIGARGLGQVS